ncbi:MAG TPA: hypothetical protein VG826_26905 [Pirellulales bacterium]|nr:hypothetical protein [Pirellulales bacterium]
MSKGYFCLLASSVLLAAAAGCTQSASIKTVPVHGKVTFKQAPLEGATVSFLAETVGSDPRAVNVNAASGVTQADGSYTLSTVVGHDVVEGVPQGKYKVTVVKRPASGGGMGSGLEGLSPAELEAKMKTMTPEQMQKMGGAPTAEGGPAQKSAIPERYANPDESGFTSTVGPNGAAPADFDLTE